MGSELLIPLLGGGVLVLLVGGAFLLGTYFERQALTALRAFAEAYGLAIAREERSQAFHAEGPLGDVGAKLAITTDAVPRYRGFDRVTRLRLSPAGEGELLLLSRMLRDPTVPMGVRELSDGSGGLDAGYRIFAADAGVLSARFGAGPRGELNALGVVRSLKLSAGEASVELFGTVSERAQLDRAVALLRAVAGV